MLSCLHIQYDYKSSVYGLSHGDVRGNKRTPRVGLAHESKHAYNRQEKKQKSGTTQNGIYLEEVDAAKFEKKVRKQTGDPQRTEYGEKKSC